MGYHYAKAIGVTAFDKRDITCRVGVRVTACVFQRLFEIFQAAGAVCGPHQQVVSQPAWVTLSMFAAFDDVQLEALLSQEKGSIPRTEGYFTSEQIAVKGHGPAKFGHEQNRRSDLGRVSHSAIVDLGAEYGQYNRAAQT
jgi:hypothetical protein